MAGIADEVEGGRFRAGHSEHAGMALTGLERGGGEIPFAEKADRKAG